MNSEKINLKNNDSLSMIKELDIDDLIMLKRRQELLDKHPYAIWQSKDGKYWYTTLPDSTKPRGVRQIRRNSEAELQDAIIEYWTEINDKKTVFDAYDEWSRNRLETKRIIKATYVNVNSVFNTNFSEIKDKSIESFQPIDWCDFLEKQLISRNLSKVQFGTLKSLTLGIIKWSYKREYIKYPASAVDDLLDIPEKAYRDCRKPDEEEVYNEKETPIIIEYLTVHRDLKNLGLLLMFVTGIRIGELVTLKHGDFVGNIVQIRRTLSVGVNELGKICKYVKDTPKTYAGIRDVVVPSTFQWLLDYFAEGDPDEFIFKTARGNIMKYDSINMRLQSICVELGIPFRTTHKIRKTYGSILLDNNVDNKFVMQQMGHTGIECTENYYHRDRKDEERKKEIIDGLNDFYTKK